MSVGLNDGSRFKVIDSNNKDITISKDVNKQAVKIQIDTDKDGKFDGENDITITDKAHIDIITDNIKGNTNIIENIPFIDEIESHLLKNGPISDLLKVAKDEGKLSDNTSIFSLDEKVQHGKKAFESVQKAFNLDKSNTNARYSYAVAIYKVNDSAFKGTAQEKLGINLDNLIKTIIPELAKDKQDPLGQMILKKLYHVTKDPKEQSIEQNLILLKKQDPVGYQVAELKVKEDFK